MIFYHLQAKDMVGLVNKFAAKIEEKKGSLTEDEVRTYLLCVMYYFSYYGGWSGIASVFIAEITYYLYRLM